MTLIGEAREFLRRLKAAGVPHMLVGAMALDALGPPRSTMDIDIQVHVEGAPTASETTYLGAVVEERSRDPVFEQDVYIVHLPTYAVPIELFVTSHWFTAQALDRRRMVQSGELDEVPVPTPEDFVLLKAAYHESSQRSRAKRAADAVDIEGVIRGLRGDVDRAYLEENARRLGVWPFLSDLM